MWVFFADVKIKLVICSRIKNQKRKTMKPFSNTITTRDYEAPIIAIELPGTEDRIIGFCDETKKYFVKQEHGAIKGFTEAQLAKEYDLNIQHSVGLERLGWTY